jgi:CHASE2 domain-containing sensor protein
VRKNENKWALVQGLYVLWALGMCAGIAISGQWLLLAAFSTAVLVGQGIATGVAEYRSKRQGK